MNLRGFLNLHKSPTTVIYISLLFRFPLLKPSPGMAFGHSEKFKTGDWEVKCLKYMDWNMQLKLGDYANRETCQIHDAARLKYQIEFCVIHFKSGLFKQRVKSPFR